MKATCPNASYLAAVSLSLLIAACGKPTEPPVPVTAPSADPAAPGAVTPSPPATTPLPETPGPAATPPSPADTMQNAPTTPNGKTPPDTTEKPQPIPSGQPAPAPSSDASPAAPAGGVTPVAANAAGGNIIAGWKTWRSAACERCHGASQEGMVGPSLIESLKRLSKEEVKKTVLEGRLERGMPSHPYLADKFDDLYAYLKGRSDGSVPKVRPEGA